MTRERSAVMLRRRNTDRPVDTVGYRPGKKRAGTYKAGVPVSRVATEEHIMVRRGEQEVPVALCQTRRGEGGESVSHIIMRNNGTRA